MEKTLNSRFCCRRVVVLGFVVTDKAKKSAIMAVQNRKNPKRPPKGIWLLVVSQRLSSYKRERERV